MAASANILLLPLSALYGAVVHTRMALYRRGMLSTHQIGVPVISVGNITTGGTGKTPFVSWLARRLAAEGYRVSILTRGYGRTDATKQVVVSDGLRLFADAATGGDEARLLGETLLGIASVISNADRVAAANWAIKNLNSDILVLDDAFQHLAIRRDLNIVTIDSTNPWGGRQLLPRGRLREPMKGLERADLIILTRTDVASDIESLRAEAERLTNNRPVILSQMRTTRVTRLTSELKSDQEEGVVVFPAQPVIAFCAIGNPTSFFDHVVRDGHQIEQNMSFRDHYGYTQKDVDELVREAKSCGAKSLVTTSKDAVKLSGLRFEIPCYAIEIEMMFDDENRLLESVNQSIHKFHSSQRDK